MLAPILVARITGLKQLYTELVDFPGATKMARQLIPSHNAYLALWVLIRIKRRYFRAALDGNVHGQTPKAPATCATGRSPLPETLSIIRVFIWIKR